MGSERRAPQETTFERMLLGGLMIDPRRIGEISAIVEPRDYFRPEHENLARLLVEMWLGKVPIDLVTVPERVARGGRPDLYGGVPYVVELVDRVPSTANLVHYAEHIRACAERRRLIGALQAATEKLYDVHEYRPMVGELMMQVTDLARPRLGGRSGATYRQATAEAAEYLERTWAASGGLAGVSTGFDDLDQVLSGLEPGTMTVLGARPSVGKSALALQITENVAVDGGWVGYFSLEMPKAQLALRSISRKAEIPVGVLKRGEAGGMTDEQFRRYADAREWNESLPIHVEDASMTGPELVAKVRALHQEHGAQLRLVVVDFLQRIRIDPGARSRVEGVGAVSTLLKDLALDLGIPVLAVASLNRAAETRRDHRPMMSDLRDSGSIESDADNIIFLHREGLYDQLTPKEDTDVIIAKNRAGPVCDLKWSFKPEIASFADTPDGLSL